MALANFTKAEKEGLIARIQKYFAKELDHEIGNLDARFQLNFIGGEIGPYFYNMGLRDAQAILYRRMNDIAGAIDELVKPTNPRR